MTMLDFEGMPSFTLAFENAGTSSTDVGGFSTGAVSLYNFGAKSHETYANFDNTVAIQNAIGSGETIYIPKGTFYTHGNTGRSGLRMYGSGNDSKLKLAPLANTSVLYFAAPTDVSLSSFEVDGNKSQQTLGRISRGVYALGTSFRLNLSYLNIKDVLDHGVFLSNGGTVDPLLDAGQDSLILGCTAQGVGGGPPHQAAGGTGGSAFVGGANTTTWNACVGRGSALNAFKCAGRLISCGALNGQNAFESGIGGTNVFFGTTYIGCYAVGNQAGWRHQGALDELIMIGCYGAENGYSGVTIFGELRRLLISNCTFKNNGKIMAGSATPYVREGKTIGVDGITIIKPNSATPLGIKISNVDCFDDQASPTQEYGIYIGDDGPTVDIQGPGDVSGNKYGSIYMPIVANPPSNVTMRGIWRGYSGQGTYAPMEVTGAGYHVMAAHTFKASERGIGFKFRINTTFYVVGTAGTKILRLEYPPGGTIFSNQLAAEAQFVIVDVNVVQTTATSVSVLITALEVGGQAVTGGAVIGVPSGSDLTFTFSTTLGGADTITQLGMTVASEL